MRSQFLITALAAGLLINAPAPAQTQAQVQTQAQTQDQAFSNPCDTAPFTDWDFWIGEWVAFDYDTGVVQGIDRVEKINNGCVIHQDWSQMTDRYRAQGYDQRYAGMSFNTVVLTADGPAWEQTWVAHYGGLIRLVGGLDEDGRMVIRTTEFAIQDGQFAKRVWYWDPEEDGSIHSWGEIYVRDGDGEYPDEPTNIPWNLRYVSRHVSDPLIAQPPAD